MFLTPWTEGHAAIKCQFCCCDNLNIQNPFCSSRSLQCIPVWSKRCVVLCNRSVIFINTFIFNKQNNGYQRCKFSHICSPLSDHFLYFSKIIWLSFSNFLLHNFLKNVIFCFHLTRNCLIKSNVSPKVPVSPHEVNMWCDFGKEQTASCVAEVVTAGSRPKQLFLYLWEKQLHVFLTANTGAVWAAQRFTSQLQKWLASQWDCQKHFISFTSFF